MLNFRKISAASDGAAIRAYMTQDQPEPECLKVHGVALGGRGPLAALTALTALTAALAGLAAPLAPLAALAGTASAAS